MQKLNRNISAKIWSFWRIERKQRCRLEHDHSVIIIYGGAGSIRKVNIFRFRLEEHLGAYVQFALMYTTGSGQRRIRIINYKFEVSSRLEQVYDSVDYLTFANVILLLFRLWQRHTLTNCWNSIQLNRAKMLLYGWEESHNNIELAVKIYGLFE